MGTVEHGSAGVGRNHAQTPAPPSARPSASAWLQLFRPPNLLTAPGDPIAGALLASAGAGLAVERIALAALAGTLLYAAGTAMNDVADVREDARERPSRPIPSGRVPRGPAAAATAALAALALVFAFLAGPLTLNVAAGLLVAIFLYNFVFKRVPLLGPLAMGACRALNLVLGAALVPGAWHGRVVVIAALALLAYVAAVSQLARRETENAPPPAHLLWLPAAVLFVGMLAFAAVAPFPAPRDMHIMTAFIVLACAQAFVSTVKPRRGRGFRRAGASTLPMVVGSLVGNVMFIQAAFAAGSGWGLDGALVGLGLVALWGVNRVLARKFYAS